MNLLEWIRKALTVWRGIFSFVLCLIFSGVLISQDHSGRMVFHQVMIGTFFYPVQAVLSRFNGTIRIYHENAQLHRENALLRAENDFLTESLRQVPRLQDMEHFRSAVSLRLKPGQIIAQDAGRLQMVWVMDLGLADSVQVNMPVITSRGMVGKTVKCFQNYSLVQLLSDPSFKAAVQVDRSRARGILESFGGSRLIARFPAGSDVLTSDTLITAGLGGVFPKGLRVGTVSHEVTGVEEQDADVIRSYQVEPFQKPGTVEEVFVLIKEDQWKLEDASP